MLNIARRGPASAASSLILRSISARCIRDYQPRDVHQCTSRFKYRFSARPNSTSSQRKQFAAGAAIREDEASGADVEQESNTVRPTTDTQAKSSADDGPVTKFRELAERGIASPVVIDTLTRQMGLENMTHVQTLTINEIIKGHDV